MLLRSRTLCAARGPRAALARGVLCGEPGFGAGQGGASPSDEVEVGYVHPQHGQPRRHLALVVEVVGDEVPRDGL